MADRKPKRGRGRPTEKGSVRSKLAEGEARQLKTVMPTELHKRLKITAVVKDRTLNDIVNEAVEEWLDKHEDS